MLAKHRLQLRNHNTHTDQNNGEHKMFSSVALRSIRPTAAMYQRYKL